MNGNQRYRQPGGFDLGFSERPPADLIALLATIFITYSLKEFVPEIQLLRLTPLVWLKGYVWQLVTYPFIGFGQPSLWILLELLMLFWFGRDVRRYLGRRQFWLLILWTTIAASVAAVATQLALTSFSEPGLDFLPFVLMQGQRLLLTVLVAAFATVYGEATIMFFFVLPIKARWFLALELLIAFIAFLQARDLAGFVGICVAVAVTFSMLSGRGPRKLLREWRLRIERRLLEAKLERMRRKRGFRVVQGQKGSAERRDPWVN